MFYFQVNRGFSIHKSILPSFFRIKTSKSIDHSVCFVYTSRLYLHFYESKPPKVQIFPCLTCKNEGKPCFQYTQLDFTLTSTSQNLPKYRSFRFLVYINRLYPHFYKSKPPKVKISARLACKHEGKSCFKYTFKAFDS